MSTLNAQIFTIFAEHLRRRWVRHPWPLPSFALSDDEAVVEFDVIVAEEHHPFFVSMEYIVAASATGVPYLTRPSSWSDAAEIICEHILDELYHNRWHLLGHEARAEVFKAKHGTSAYPGGPVVRAGDGP